MAKMSNQIYELMPKVAKSIGAVAKDGFNAHHKYKFRGIDALYNSIQAALIEHGITTVPRVTQQDVSVVGKMRLAVIKLQLCFYAPDGSCVTAEVPGEGADTGDKACNKAVTSAMKNAYVHTFAIPTEDGDDSENDSPVIDTVGPPSRERETEANTPRREATSETDKPSDRARSIAVAAGAATTLGMIEGLRVKAAGLSKREREWCERVFERERERIANETFGDDKVSW